MEKPAKKEDLTIEVPAAFGSSMRERWEREAVEEPIVGREPFNKWFGRVVVGAVDAARRRGA